MRVLFIFLDGVGLGGTDPAKNPFAYVRMATLEGLLDGKPLVEATAPYDGARATLLALDAALGVPGLPQSATGQAVLLTGMNVPSAIGGHYGPKPNPAVAEFIMKGTLFSRLLRERKTAALLNAYPPRYFEAVESGRRLLSSIPLAVRSAGLRLFDKDDFFAGQALSADFTGEGWAQMLGFPKAPVREPQAAGRHLGELAKHYDFSLFEYWATDYAGHKQDGAWARSQLAVLDGVLSGLLEAWDTENDLILVTSDHGNMEDLGTRRHTSSPVPCLLIGSSHHRRLFSRELRDLTDIAPAILQALGIDSGASGVL
jgi:2,3-bisphosphoglycerate-independent phosphoglycerate mutase